MYNGRKGEIYVCLVQSRHRELAVAVDRARARRDGRIVRGGIIE
jgi:hypothetical protein